MIMEEVILTTKDGIQLYADYYQGPRPDAPGVVLLHMMPATKESWADFAPKLQLAGFQALAIDFRGHGKSTTKDGETINYKNFNDQEHQQKIHDIEEAVRFLINKNNPAPKMLFFVGASIGANLSLQYMAEHTRIKGGVLLSPGLNYRGIKTSLSAEKIADDQSIFLIASENDDNYSADTAKKILETLNCKKQIKILQDAGHGTDMFKTYPELMDEIINWLKIFIINSNL